MLTISIPSHPSQYNIQFDDSISILKEKLFQHIDGRNHIFVTDENVFEKTVFFEGIPVENIVQLTPGEEHKTWKSIESILEKCFANQLDRSSVIIAVGGGVVGDMTGFASSIFMRGIPFIQVPTTLLSMVDSSVGGKTGIDTPHGKNLIGAFHQPEAVFCAQPFLETLEFVEIQNGLSEMVKHGILGSPEHFAHLEQFAKQFETQFANATQNTEMRSHLFSLVPESITVKKNIVEQDEKESGVRGFLNLGHTYGHAIELLSNFTIPHGIGVAKGMWCAVQESKKRNILAPSAEQKIQNIFSCLNINIHHSFDTEELVTAMAHDKKKQDGKIRLILPLDIGTVEYFFL